MTTPAISNLPLTAVDEISTIFASSEYGRYGLRVVTSLSDHYRSEWLEKNGLPALPALLQVGQIAPCSYRWDDGDITNEQLDGTSAIELSSDVAKALAEIKAYAGRQVALLGSHYASDGADGGEIVMRDAVVLAVWDITAAQEAR